MEQNRKSSQEVEIDHLLAEEFKCDPEFARKFLLLCGLTADGFTVRDVVVEPSLGGNGFGDLFVWGSREQASVLLMIEDKITAAAAVRQAERYAEHASRLRSDGVDEVYTILVAPAGYQGEREKFDASTSLEAIRGIISSSDDRRLEHRRGIIDRALQKRVSNGVKVADPLLHELKRQYLLYLNTQNKIAGMGFKFPDLREKYYDGDSWIEKISNRSLPSHVKIRHRLWTSAKAQTGMVDLIASPADEAERQRFLESAPAWAKSGVFSKGKGVLISVEVPEMKQASGFDKNIADQALKIMTGLTDWYRSGHNKE